LRPAGFAVRVTVTGVFPLGGDTVSQGALLKVAVKGTAVTGLLEIVNVCWTAGPPTTPFRNTVKELIVNVFCACRVPAAPHRIKARVGTECIRRFNFILQAAA
jgi:hypothetical protein